MFQHAFGLPKTLVLAVAACALMSTTRFQKFVTPPYSIGGKL